MTDFPGVCFRPHHPFYKPNSHGDRKPSVITDPVHSRIETKIPIPSARNGDRLLQYKRGYRSVPSEEVGHAQLPGVVAAALPVQTECAAGSLGCRLPSDISRLATGDIIVGTYLEMSQGGDAETEVNAEVALLDRKSVV